MSLSASALPASGPTPGVFVVTASGGMLPYGLGPAPSPPNPVPIPPYHSTGTNPWEVEIRAALPPGQRVFFVVADAHGDAVMVSYTAN